MCAIAGLVINQSVSEATKVVGRCLAAMRHRGPDDRAVVSLTAGALGHNRLAILDLSSAGNQPMTSHSGRSVISFNGEIYNYQELRDSFPSGTKWRGHSDTEAILEVFERDGLNSLAQRQFEKLFFVAHY